MALQDRDVYLRNYVMGVLVSYSDKGLSYSNMGELADALTEAVIEGDRKWQNEQCCAQVEDIQEIPTNCCFFHTASGGSCNEDVPQ